MKNDTVFACVFLLYSMLPNNVSKNQLVTDFTRLIEEYDGKVDYSLIGLPGTWEKLLKIKSI